MAEQAEEKPSGLKLLAPGENSKDVAEITEADFPELPDIIDGMKDVINAHRGLALAGPQVGYNKRIVVVKELNPAPNNTDPWDVLINPSFEPLEKLGTDEGEEGCLTFSGEMYTVRRYLAVNLIWFSPIIEGKNIVALKRYSGKIYGGWARVAQHECDHLNGKLLSDVGVKVDQAKYLEESAALAGLVFDKEKGIAFQKDEKTGQLVPVDMDDAMQRTVNAKEDFRAKVAIKASRVERRDSRREERKKILARRKKEKQNKKRAKR